MNMALHAVQRTVIGARILADWLGAGGGPVDNALAESRAAICRSCPENSHPRWWESHNNAIALAMREMLELKNEIGYSVSQEDKLHLCRACGCCLKLKVHVPIEHIKAHTLPDAVDKYPDHCWIRNELKTQ